MLYAPIIQLFNQISFLHLFLVKKIKIHFPVHEKIFSLLLHIHENVNFPTIEGNALTIKMIYFKTMMLMMVQQDVQHKNCTRTQLFWDFFKIINMHSFTRSLIRLFAKVFRGFVNFFYVVFSITEIQSKKYFFRN